MAAGPLPLGIAAFAVVKLAGYTLAGRTLNRANHVTRPRPLAFGAGRTLLGIIAGVSYATILARFGVHRSEVWYYVNLFPVRQLEWLLMLVLFYPRSDRRRYIDSTLGTFWSYLLDVPAVALAWVIPGGFWIC